MGLLACPGLGALSLACCFVSILWCPVFVISFMNPHVRHKYGQADLDWDPSPVTHELSNLTYSSYRYQANYVVLQTYIPGL